MKDKNLTISSCGKENLRPVGFPDFGPFLRTKMNHIIENCRTGKS